MDNLLDIMLGAGELILLAAVTGLAWLLRGERQARAIAVAALAERQASAEERSLRLALLDRRLAIIAPIDDLRLALSRGCRPEARLVSAAIQALGGGRLLFPASLADEIAEIEALLQDYGHNQAWQRDAIVAGRHEERIALAEAETAIELSLKPRLARAGARLAEAARIED